MELNPDDWILGQGTIYPDTIETGGTKHADTIKTHHNRVNRVQKMIEEGKVIEPIAQLYKDEVRLVGERLGLIEEMVWRHPFPGPGLAVRMLCAESEDYPDDNEKLEEEINSVVSSDGLKCKVLPIKSVGVQGDERTYRHPVLVYGNQVSWDRLNTLSTQLTNQFPDVNRVVYGLRPSEVGDVTTQKNWMTKERVLIIQKADKVVMDFILEAGINREIWQFPTVLIPVSMDGKNESIVLRPVCSEEAMTANFYPMEQDKLNELTKRLAAIKGVSGIFYDITNKPPGTIEWE